MIPMSWMQSMEQGLGVLISFCNWRSDYLFAGGNKELATSLPSPSTCWARKQVMEEEQSWQPHHRCWPIPNLPSLSLATSLLLPERACRAQNCVWPFLGLDIVIWPIQLGQLALCPRLFQHMVLSLEVTDWVILPSSLFIWCSHPNTTHTVPHWWATWLLFMDFMRDYVQMELELSNSKDGLTTWKFWKHFS